MRSIILKCERDCPHHHARLEGGRPQAAAIYPPDMCLAILRGLRDHLEEERDAQIMIGHLGIQSLGGPFEDMPQESFVEATARQC